MSLPVSSYEELLRRVRSLTHETRRLHRELAACSDTPQDEPDVLTKSLDSRASSSDRLFESAMSSRRSTFSRSDSDVMTATTGKTTSSTSLPHQPLSASEEDRTLQLLARLGLATPQPPSTHDLTSPLDRSSDQDLTRSSTSSVDGSCGSPPPPESTLKGPTTGPPGGLGHLYHGTWPVDPPAAAALWHSGPASLTGPMYSSSASGGTSEDHGSVHSFSISHGHDLVEMSGLAAARRSYSQQQLGAKYEMVYGLLSMLGTNDDRQDMARTLLAMSSSPDSCQAMRQSGCLPLLIQLVHGHSNGEDSAPGRSIGISASDRETRIRASQALHNVVHASQGDEKRGRREARVLRLLEQVRDYCDALSIDLERILASQPPPRARGAPLLSLTQAEMERHPGTSVAALMKLSFDEEHRLAMCQLGGLHCVAELLELDHAAHGAGSSDQYCVTLRRYAGMALTNLTFGDGGNKALLCSLRPFMRALVGQLDSPSEDLRQVTASVLRNLSWRADTSSKGALREVGAVPGLMRAAMDAQKESTLKSILSALWNLSAHCSVNKVDICVVPGALPFLVSMLTYQAPSKTLAIVENAGGILRNISSHIAVREDYRAILRQHNCLQILLQQLKSPSLTVVSNACGALWNLSARSPEDQAALWEMGAVPMLRSLVNSKHKMISMGSSAALKNLLSARPSTAFDLIGNGAKAAAVALGLTSSTLPVGLYVRKQRALEQELDDNLAETCDNIEPSTSPTVPLRDETSSRYSYSSVTSMDHVPSRRSSLAPPRYRTPGVARSDSKDSVTSTHSDSVYERLRAASAGNKFSYSQTAAVSGVVTSAIVTNKLSRSEDQTSLHNSLGRRTEIENNSDRRFLSRYANAIRELRHTPGTNSNGSMIDNPLPTSSTMSTIEENKSLSGAKPRTSNFPAYNRKSNDTYVSKLSDLEFEETQEQPVNYSLKFVEPKTEEKQESCKNNLDRNYPGPFDNPATTSTKNNLKMNVVYGDYAETDLDQPTDYSLKYADEEEDDKDEYYESTVPHISSEDSTKTYCTEGTPYNFSTATSMSDLLVEEKPVPKSDLKEDKKIETKEIDSKIASGVMSPEKPIQYFEEGTPVCFSRVSSLSSLNSVPQMTTTNTLKVIKPEPKELDKEIKLKEEKEIVKAVTFVEYQQETPLMFSRCSSLGSLSSFDQHSMHDDRSSVVSDFSRLTSGMVSPSELPDSPTQTVPASPRHPMTRLPNRPITTGASQSPQSPGPTTSTANPSSSNAPNLLPQAKRSVFEDQISSFKEEDAPFSCATSLSSLTIDDDPKPTRISFRKEKEEGYEKQDVEKECSELAPVSEEEENDEDMLAACINIGKQSSNIKRITQPSTSVVTRIPRVTGIPKIIKAISPPTKDPFDFNDTLQTYCTEGTPANISHAGSHSDLSILSFPSELGAPAALATIPLEEREESNLDESADINLNISDSSSNISGDNDNMLAECIQSGMPKSRQLSVRRVFEQSSPVASRPTPAAPFLTTAIKSVPLPVTTDEIRPFDVEGTPFTVSRGSSLSDLTIHSIDDNQVTRAGLIKRRARNRGQLDEASSTVPTVYESIDDQFEIASNSGAQAGKSSTSDNIITVLSRNGSLSSLSVDSLGSAEPSPAEQALLEQCINSGMPKSKSNSQLNSNSLIPCNEDAPKNGITPASAPNVDVESTVTNIDIDQGETMIRSLDRLTKELVGGLNLEPVESIVEMRQSATDTGNTWNEEESTSPNDVTFPTCSMSQSSNGNQPQNNNITHHLSEVIEEDSLTSSQALEMEADKIVAAVKAMDQSVSSCGDFDLDKVNPPSQMDSLISLSASMTSMTESDRRCPRTPKSRKKSLPLGMMVRRALGNCNNGSTESILENLSLCSNLDQQKPPSAMEDLPDAADMENSMLSVASITSEVADLAKHSPPADDSEDSRPIAFPQPSFPDFPDTEATYSEIDSLTHKIEDDFSEHTAVISESSVESTPKRKSKLRRIPTPRERRNIGKDRYRTYTINNNDIEEAKKTPRQRRQLDRQRFETRVLDSSALIAATTAVSTPEPEDDGETAETLTPDTSQPNSPRRITPKQRRSENKDRFRTRTLKDELPAPTEEMLERNANIVISTLKSVDTRTESETQSGDEFLDLETLSLVSIDSDTDTGGARRQSSKPPDLVQAQAQAPAQPDLVQPCDHDDIEDDDDDEEEDLPEDPEEPKKPRIIKPGESIERDSSVESEKEVKGIRGRRKPLYSSPSVTTRRTANTIKLPTVHQVRPTRASSMRQTGKSNMPVSKPPSAKSSPKKTNKSVPTMSPPPPPPKPLERQGTFTKDEPTHKTKIPILSASPRRVASAPASEKGGSVSRARAATTPPQRLSRISTTQVKRSTPGLVNSSSTQSLKSGGQLSTSNQSINSISSSVGKRTTNKKEVTSKIASLWKRVEESKAKQQHQQTTIRKDTRVWIGGNNGEQQQQSQLQKPSKLMRSSTFEGGIPVASRNSQTKTTTTRLQNNNTRGNAAVKHRASGDFSWTSPDQQQQVTMRGGKTPEDPTKRFSRLGSFVKAGQDQSPAAIKITSV